MSFTPGMADSDGDFGEALEGGTCRKCESAEVVMRTWESSCGGWEDYHYRCLACGYSWWVDGIDS